MCSFRTHPGPGFPAQGVPVADIDQEVTRLDRMVRDAPERAYDADFFQTLAKEVGWKLGAN